MIRRDCQQRALQIQAEQALARHNRKLAKLGVSWDDTDDQPNEIRNPVNRVPLKHRPSVVEYGVNHPKKKPPPDLPEEVLYAIDVIRQNAKAAGFHTAPLPRLYKGRNKVIAAVASDWGISIRTVRSIWEGTRDV
jgi:hypothetical protein